MTRDEARQFIPIITAYANGETIQYDSVCGGWVDSNPEFCFEPERYRIKPKPREVWAIFPSTENGLLSPRIYMHDWHIGAVKFREVTDE